MKLGKEYLWKYLIIMFSIALALVVLSSVQQMRTQKLIESTLKEQKVLTEGIQSNMVSLTKENEELQQEVSKLSKKLTKNVEDMEKLDLIVKVKTTLIDVQMSYNNKDYIMARKSMEEINTDLLDQKDLDLYKLLENRLKK